MHNQSRLVLIRHGQSTYNEKNLFTGWEDVSLTSKGIDKNMFTTNNYGEENPAATNATKEGRALNRRAQLKVTLK